MIFRSAVFLLCRGGRVEGFLGAAFRAGERAFTGACSFLSCAVTFLPFLVLHHAPRFPPWGKQSFTQT
ncbi:hypothetical protein ApDm4_0963 [Acetobacter pomorum]|nr:hypothetical protein ApDm4_0963 [Acetobacter pomorum]